MKRLGGNIDGFNARRATFNKSSHRSGRRHPRPPAQKSKRRPFQIGLATIGATTLPSASGPNISDVVALYSDQREDLEPRSGRDIQNTTLPSRYGASRGEGNAPASALPS